MKPGALREAYEAMSDHELLEFAKIDGLKLTSDAFLTLREELNKREIGSEIISKLEHEIILQQSLHVKRFEENFTKDLLVKGYTYAFDMKMNDASDAEIRVGLQAMNISSDYAFYMLKDLKVKANDIVNDCRQNVKSGIAIAALGGFIIYVTSKIERFEGVAFMILILGVTRVIIFFNKKNKYERIFRKLDETKNTR